MGSKLGGFTQHFILTAINLSFLAFLRLTDQTHCKKNTQIKTMHSEHSQSTRHTNLFSNQHNVQVESKHTNSGLTHFQKLPISIRNNKQSINKFKIELMKFIENKCLYTENYIHWYYLLKTEKEFQPDNFLPSTPVQNYPWRLRLWYTVQLFRIFV